MQGLALATNIRWESNLKLLKKQFSKTLLMGQFSSVAKGGGGVNTPPSLKNKIHPFPFKNSVLTQCTAH